jgi:hypothetical protein
MKIKDKKKEKEKEDNINVIRSQTISYSNKNQLREEMPKYQILGQAGGDYITTKLPNNFFEDLMFGEMDLEYNFSIEGLTKLMDLYSLGIQYYLENNPIQAKYFQDRMGFLLTNKDILMNLKKQQDKEEKEKNKKDEDNNEGENDKTEFPKSSPNLPKIETRQRAKTNFIIRSKTIKKEDFKKKINNVLDDSNKIIKEKENVKNIINEELNNQNMKWKEKLSKKRENFNASFGFNRQRNRTTIRKTKSFHTPNSEVSTFNTPKSVNQDDFQFGLNSQHNKTDKTDKSNGSKTVSNFDIDFSEKDEMEKNEGDIEFSKEINKINKFEEKYEDKNKENENKKIDNQNNDNDSDSSSGSDSDSDDESKKMKNSSEFLKKIDEVDEEKEFFPQNNEDKKEELDKEKNDIDANKAHHIENENLITDNKENKENIINNNEIKGNENSISTQTTEIKNDFLKENVRENQKLDDEIVKVLEEKMGKIESLTNNDKDDEEASEGGNDDNKENNFSFDDLPVKFQETYTEIDIKMNRYVNDLNSHFFKSTFEVFSNELKDLYEKKYKKYIEVNDEYHTSIKEKEFLLENDEDLNENQKNEIHQIIDSLKEEQKDQIDKIIDEYNQLIDSKINEFKRTAFKNDCEMNVIEEQLKLDIYTMINEAFY